MNPELATETVLSWSPLLPGWGLVLAGGLAAALLFASWRNTRGVRRGRRALLVGLRVVALIILAAVLGGPESVHTEGRKVRDPFVVLLDASRSMRVEDASGGSRASQVSGWLRSRSAEFDALREDYDLRFFLVGEELTEWTPASPSTGDGASQAPDLRPSETAARGGELLQDGDYSADSTSTDLGQALFGLRDQLGQGKPAGVLLASDGADRAALGRALASRGPEAVEELAAGLDFPVSTWAVGSLEGPADLAVRAAHAPPFGFVRRPFQIEVDLAKQGLPAGLVAVRLEGEGELLSRRDVVVAEDGEASAVFEVKPDSIGYHTYRVSVPVPEGDTIPSNNEIEFTVKVVRDRTRVLQVTSRPSWDVKFLRRLLKTDPNIDLVSFFILRTNEYQGELARHEELSLIAFPYEELFGQDLQGFDLVIFQNFWFGSFASFSDTELLENVASYVEDGGAFLMIGGDVAFGEADYGSSPLARVLPTDVPRLGVMEDSFSAELSGAGRRHPVTRLDRDPDRNEVRWSSLPQLQGFNPLGEVMPGGVTLLQTGEQGYPLAAVRSVGKGRSMAFANDTTWRWALAGTEGPGAGRDHSDFWRGAMRWLVKDAEERQVQVLTDKENYHLGETVQIQVRVLGEDYSPRADVPVSLSLSRASGLALQEPVEGSTDAAGQFSLPFVTDTEGTIVVDVRVPSLPEPFGQAEARVSVSDRVGELEDPRVRPELLAALSEATGGVVLSGSAPDPSDAQRSPAESLLAVDRRVVPLWSQPWLLALLVLPLGIEWILRRRLGLR